MGNTTPFGSPSGSQAAGRRANAGRGQGRGTGRGRLVALAIGAVAVLVVAIVAVRTLSGDDAAGGGSNSPESAVNDFLAAVHDEDPLALVDLLVPSETDLVRDGVQSFLDVVSGKDTTSAIGKAYDQQHIGHVDLADLVPGFAIDFQNVELQTQKLGAEFAKVSLRRLDATWTFDAGTFSDAIDLSAVNGSQQPSIKDDEGSFDENDVKALYGSDSPIDAPFLVAAKVSGRWYVSIELTALETARVLAHLDAAEWGDLGPTKNFGGDTPADAVQKLIRALARGRTADAIETLPPDRYESLYRFRKSFTDFTSQAAVQFDIVDNKTVDDDRGTVLPLDGSTITITRVDPTYGDKDTVTVLFDNDCVTYNEQKYDAYYDETTTSDGMKCWTDLADLADDFAASADSTVDLSWLKDIPDIDAFWVNVRKIDGRWFVDPLATVSAYTSIIASAAKD